MENDLTNHRALIKHVYDLKEILITEASPDGQYVKYEHPVYGWKVRERADTIIADLGPKPKRKGFFG